MPKVIPVTQADIDRLPPEIRNNPELMTMVRTIVTTYTKLEQMLGVDVQLILNGLAPVPAHVVPASGTDGEAPTPLEDDFPANWTQLGGKPLSKSAAQAPLAKVLTATIKGSTLHLTFAPVAKTGRWWAPHDEYCYGPHGFVWFVDGQWWSAYCDWFPMTLRPSEQIGNIFKADTPFAAHPPVVGCPAWWLAWNDDGTQRSNPAKVNWE